MRKNRSCDDRNLFPSRAADILSIERTLWRRGYKAVAGVDEAGRGPLAGPVVAAAVILGPEFDVTGLDDSKKLPESTRLILYERICREALSCAVGMADAREIETLNILSATKTSMCRALDQLTTQPDYVLVDGNQKIPICGRQRTVVGGDGKSASIAAASILAKVTRDLIMAAYHERWPSYRFNTNKGYPTAEHRRAVARFGPCSIHRRTFSGVKERC